MENTQIILWQSLHQLKVIVWCTIWSGGIIEPCFFEYENDVTELWMESDIVVFLKTF